MDPGVGLPLSMGDGSRGAHDSRDPAADRRPRPPSGSAAWRVSGRSKFWRSPPDQPEWARPLLLAVAALAALSYAWGMNTAARGVLRRRRAQHVRELAQLLLRCIRPLGHRTIDKLPGAVWVQALSVRLFGFHVWAIVLPQVVEGALTVLVLYRAVRRVAGAGAGLAAAAVLAATPVHVLLNRGNISDSLLILLLVLAADATTAAFTTGRVAHLMIAGLWVGLAFQAKMLQAWLVLPGPLPRVSAGGARTPVLARRLGHAALAPAGGARGVPLPGARRHRPSQPTTGPTSTAAATTRSSARSSSTTALTG